MPEPDSERRDDADNPAWSMLFDWGMSAYPANTPIGGGVPRELIGPIRVKNGRYVHVSACLRDDRIIDGLLYCHVGGRLIIAPPEGDIFVTFHTADALSVAVAYVEPPEDSDG